MQGLSQDGGSSPIGYGVKIGASMSDFVDHFDAKYSSFQPGVSAGVFGSYKVMDMLSVSLDLLYAQKGARKLDQSVIYDTQGPLFDADYISKVETNVLLQSAQADLRANIILPLGNDAIVHRLVIGDSFGWIFNATATNDRKVLLGNYSTVSKDNITERFARFDNAAFIGLGVDLDVSSYAVSIDFDYRPGLFNINNVEHFAPFSSNSYNLTIGVKL